MNSTSTSEYCNMWSKSERAYPTPVGDRRSFQSIKYPFGPDLRVFPSVSLICGGDTYCSFLVDSTKTFRTQMESCRGYDPRRLRRWWKRSRSHSRSCLFFVFFLTVVLCQLLSLLGCLVCTYILLSYRAVERRASQCWCSMGNPLHFQGSPVSTGCWEVLGYWVCLSLDQGSYRNRQ